MSKSMNCPCCGTTVKITKGGKLSRHGYKGNGAGVGRKGCPMGGRVPYNDGLFAAIDYFAQAAEGWRGQPGRRAAHKAEHCAREAARLSGLLRAA